jgi:hypothetical protein
MLVVCVPARIEIAELCDLPGCFFKREKEGAAAMCNMLQLSGSLCESVVCQICASVMTDYEKIRVLTCLDLTDKEFSS